MKLLKIYLSIVLPVALICMFLIISGQVELTYNGFAVDTNNVLYIGKDDAIEKYYEGKLVEKLNPQTSRAYVFTIESDTIILSTSSKVYTLDLQGNVIEEQEDEGTKIFNRLEREKNVFVSDVGKTYNLKSEFGRLSITNESGKVMYKMPTMDYIVKLMSSLVFISVFIFVPVIIKKERIDAKKNIV